MKNIRIIFILLIFPSVAIAAGIQASPEKLMFNISNGKALTEEITVVNPTADVQLFEVYPDDFDRFIKVFPASFTLEAGGSKDVQITLDPKQFSNSASGTTLSVLGKSLAENKVQINAGIKIPIIITVSEKKQRSWILLTVIVIIIAGLGYLLKKTKKAVNL